MLLKTIHAFAPNYKPLIVKELMKLGRYLVC